MVYEEIVTPEVYNPVSGGNGILFTTPNIYDDHEWEYPHSRELPESVESVLEARDLVPWVRDKTTGLTVMNGDLFRSQLWDPGLEIPWNILCMILWWDTPVMN